MTLQVTDIGDGHLIEAYRAGDDAAADELFRRHHRSALRLARSIMGESSADDVASESFVRVLQALRNGHGPQIAFRPYLLTTVRNTSYEAIRKASRDVLVDDVETVTGADVDGGYALNGESQVLSRAFHALPERWQVVLWHTAIDGEPPAKVAEVLGIRPTAVAALAYRAREGLRQAYIAEHVPDATAPRCTDVRGKLPAHLRRQLAPVASARIVAHLETCPWCAVVEQDLRALSGDLGAVLLPALLGTTAAFALGGTAVAAGSGVATGLFSQLPLQVAQTVSATTAAVVVAGVAVTAGPTTTLGPGAEPVPQAIGSLETIEPPSSAVRVEQGDGRPRRGTPVTEDAPAEEKSGATEPTGAADEARRVRDDLADRVSDRIDAAIARATGGTSSVSAPVTQETTARTLAAEAETPTSGERLVDHDDWRSLVSFDYTPTSAGVRIDVTLDGKERTWSLGRSTLTYGGWECRKATEAVLRCDAEDGHADRLWSGLRLTDVERPAATPTPTASAEPRERDDRAERKDSDRKRDKKSRDRSEKRWSWPDLDSWRDRDRHPWGW